MTTAYKRVGQNPHHKSSGDSYIIFAILLLYKLLLNDNIHVLKYPGQRGHYPPPPRTPAYRDTSYCTHCCWPTYHHHLQVSERTCASYNTEVATQLLREWLVLMEEGGEEEWDVVFSYLSGMDLALNIPLYKKVMGECRFRSSSIYDF